MVKYGYMISYDEFAQALANREIAKLNFFCASKEYVIQREDSGNGSLFLFLGEDFDPVSFETAEELLASVAVAGSPLKDVWLDINPVCTDNLADEDYISTMYGDSLGKPMSSAAGTAATHERYFTQYCVPSLAIGLVVLVIFLFCTLFIKSLPWTFFGIVVAVIVAAFIISQIIFISNTKRYRPGNPHAYLYLLNEGAVILTDRFEYAIPYEKILRLDTEAGISIVTIRTVFSFTPDNGTGIAGTLKSIVDELHAIKTSLIKRMFKKKGKKG